MLLVMVTLHTFSWEKSFTLGKLTRVNKRPHRWSQHLGLPYKNLNFIRVMEVLAGKQTETALCSKAKPIKEKFSSYQFPATSQVRAVFVQIFPFLSWKQHHPPERVVWVLWSFFVRLLYFRQHALLAKLVFQSDYNLASVINAFADEGPFFCFAVKGKKFPEVISVTFGKLSTSQLFLGQKCVVWPRLLTLKYWQKDIFALGNENGMRENEQAL